MLEIQVFAQLLRYYFAAEFSKIELIHRMMQFILSMTICQHLLRRLNL